MLYLTNNTTFVSFKMKRSKYTTLLIASWTESNVQGGSSSKVVECILCLKGYYEWKQAGGIGVWRYGGTVRITSFPKDCSSSSISSESADDSFYKLGSCLWSAMLS